MFCVKQHNLETKNIGVRHKTCQGQESATGQHHISSNPAAFSGPVLFSPEKRVFFGGSGGGGLTGKRERGLISRTAVGNRA